jgi:hypothetical protein
MSPLSSTKPCRIRNIYIFCVVYGNPVGKAQVRRRSESNITGNPVRASPGYGGDDAGQGIYPAYTVIASVPDEYMPR